MQLSRLYSDLENIFSPISFNYGAGASTLNVIYASVKKPKDKTKDSHNLGKSKLIDLLDFCLLKDIKDGHFLSLSKHRFMQFSFYLELFTTTGEFVTIRRSVLNENVISLNFDKKSNEDLSALPITNWSHPELNLTAAVELLDAHLNLTVISPWPYRKGCSYFLRSQRDYIDVFQISKFLQGKHSTWKPYLAKLFGLDHTLIEEKYKIDQDIIDKDDEVKNKRLEIPHAHTDKNQLVTQIDIKRDEIEQSEASLDRFDFSQEIQRINKSLVNELESKISSLSNDLYMLESDLQQLSNSISRDIKFDLDKTTKIFEECQVLIPDSLIKDYESLVQFNKSITQDRNRILKKRIKALEEEKIKIIKTLDELNTQKADHLSAIREADTFVKFKLLQKYTSKRRSELSMLEAYLERLDELTELEAELTALTTSRTLVIAKIDSNLRSNPDVKQTIVKLFNRYVKKVLNINGEFVVSQNGEGNLDFKIRTTDDQGNDTSQGDGNTYSQVLCALFDLAVLKALEDKAFFHFTYHDGILESLDDRKKIALLDLIREVIADGKIQYMLSCIDADLPRDENGKKIEFSDKEVILTLHDDGDDGRLFKMPSF